jgi:hypothetical protein
LYLPETPSDGPKGVDGEQSYGELTMSKKTAAKLKGKRRTSMKAPETFVPPHDPVRALGEWMDRLGNKRAQKPTERHEVMKREKKSPLRQSTTCECRIIVMVEGSPQQLTELMEKAKKLKLFL